MSGESLTAARVLAEIRELGYGENFCLDADKAEALIEEYAEQRCAALRAENKRMHIHALNDASEIATLRDELTRTRQQLEAALVMMREVTR